MPNDNLAFGIDLSRYNTSADGKVKVDFEVIAAHQPEVVFIAMRAGVSWGYQDPWFAYYLAEAQRIERVCLAYHVLYPGEPVVAQMDNFFRILGDVDLSQVPLVLVWNWITANR
jgi:GH25 family lysozyme M1 (1,4-beta-N-acetylmuramidase)